MVSELRVTVHYPGNENHSQGTLEAPMVLRVGDYLKPVMAHRRETLRVKAVCWVQILDDWYVEVEAVWTEEWQ